MKKIHWILLAIITIISLIGQFSIEHHHYFWDAIPGIYAVYGFVGCIAIVKVSKWYGNKIVFREEDHYDN